MIRYYEFDDVVARALAGKKLKEGVRKTLDEGICLQLYRFPSFDIHAGFSIIFRRREAAYFALQCAPPGSCTHNGPLSSLPLVALICLAV